MKYTIEYNIQEVALNDLMLCYHPKRVLGYCEACNNYGKIWSCPPHQLNVSDFLQPYNQLFVIGAKVVIKSEWVDKEKPLDSVTNVFLKARQQFGKVLYELEKEYLNSQAMIAGTCYQCDKCTRYYGLSCKYPDKMRHSLESIGFDVDQIVKTILKDEIVWNGPGGYPPYLLSVGMMMLPQTVEKLEINNK